MADEKLFTQEDVDRIVTDRLARERRRAASEAAEAAPEYEQRIHELEQELVKTKAREILSTRGLPSALGDFLDYTNAETCLESIEKLEPIFNESVQDRINERLGRPSPALPRPNDRDVREDDAAYYNRLFCGRF